MKPTVRDLSVMAMLPQDPPKNPAPVPPVTIVPMQEDKPKPELSEKVMCHRESTCSGSRPVVVSLEMFPSF